MVGGWGRIDSDERIDLGNALGVWGLLSIP